MNDEKQRRREIEILEYIRRQEELEQAEAEAARGGGILLIKTIKELHQEGASGY
jgi:hypothetical protein